MVMAMIRVGTITGVVLLLSSCGASAGFFSFLEGGEAEKVVETKQQASSPWRAKLHETQLSEQQWQQVLSRMEKSQQKVVQEDRVQEQQLLTREAVRNYLLSRARKDSLIQDPAVQRQLEQVLVENWLNRNTLPAEDYPDQQVLEQAWKENQKQFVVEAQVALSQIFIARDDEGEAKEQIESLEKMLRSDPDQFPILAKQYSQHQESAEMGGRMGSNLVKQLQPKILQAIGNLKQGELSAIVEMPGGYHLLRVDEIQPTRVRPLVEVKPLLVKALRLKRQNEKKQVVLQELTQAVELRIDSSQ